MTQHNHLEHWLAQERDILATLDAGPGPGVARREQIGPDDLPPHEAAGLQLGPSPTLPRQITLAEAERVHILETLERFGNNHSGAAGALGIGRTTLWRKLEEYGIEK